MSIITIDFRFSTIMYELEIIKNHLDIIEKSIPIITKQLWDDHDKRVASYDEDDAYFDYQEVDDVVNNALPRFLLNSYIVGLWAVFESAVIEITSFTKEKIGQKKELDKMNERGLLNKCHKYYTVYLNIEFINKDTVEWQQIGRLYKLRNAIAHANGRIEAISKGEQAAVQRWVKEEIVTISNLGDFFYVKLIYAHEILELISSFLKDLVSRAKIQCDIISFGTSA